MKTVLSREEALAFAMSNLSRMDVVRSTERAVLDKMEGFVSPAEARERERTAMRTGIVLARELSRRDLMNRAGNYPDAIVDRHYPSLTAPKPKTVRLSDGTEWLFAGGEWLRQFDYGVSGATRGGLPSCHIPEDFEAVAQYLREVAP